MIVVNSDKLFSWTLKLFKRASIYWYDVSGQMWFARQLSRRHSLLLPRHIQNSLSTPSPYLTRRLLTYHQSEAGWACRFGHWRWSCSSKISKLDPRGRDPLIFICFLRSRQTTCTWSTGDGDKNKTSPPRPILSFVSGCTVEERSKVFYSNRLWHDMTWPLAPFKLLLPQALKKARCSPCIPILATLH